ncbi:16016_t:CDS:2, partial [Racocetra persica]
MASKESPEIFQNSYISATICTNVTSVTISTNVTSVTICTNVTSVTICTNVTSVTNKKHFKVLEFSVDKKDCEMEHMFKMKLDGCYATGNRWSYISNFHESE